MSTVCWIVGEPGCGKTTLVRALLGQVMHLIEKPKWSIFQQGCAAGHYTGKAFDGADTLGYTQGAEAARYWREMLLQQPLTLLDGDRMSNSSILQQFVGYQREIDSLRLCCIFMDIPRELCAARRQARSAQDETWARGRRTKAWNFFVEFADGLAVYQETELELVKKFLAKPKEAAFTEKQGKMF